MFYYPFARNILQHSESHWFIKLNPVLVSPFWFVVYLIVWPTVKSNELQAIKSELTQIKSNIDALLGRLDQITEDKYCTTGEEL